MGQGSAGRERRRSRRGTRFPDSDSHRSLGCGRSQEQGALAPEGEKRLRCESWKRRLGRRRVPQRRRTATATGERAGSCRPEARPAHSPGVGSRAGGPLTTLSFIPSSRRFFAKCFWHVFGNIKTTFLSLDLVMFLNIRFVSTGPVGMLAGKTPGPCRLCPSCFRSA